MQVRDTPLRVNERGKTVTLSVGAGGSGIYYGPSESAVKTSTAAPGAQVTITSPMYVQSQGLRDGPPADLDILGGDVPAADSSGVLAEIDALGAQIAQTAAQVVYGSGAVPPRPSGFALVVWRGTADPAANALEGDEWVGP